jgi:hypothetical protein
MTFTDLPAGRKPHERRERGQASEECGCGEGKPVVYSGHKFELAG